MADNYGNSTTSAGTLPIGGQITSDIEVDGDEDWFRVALTGGTTYRFDLRGVAGEEWARDSLVVRLFDADGADLRGSARTDVNGEASMVFTPLSSGKYHLVVRKDGYTADGHYTVQAAVAALQDDFRDDNATAGAVAIGGQVFGSIEVAADTDWFKVQLEAGRTYEFELLGANGGGTAQHPGLKVLNPDAAVMGPLSRGGTDANPVYAYTALASGTHYLAASNGAETGTYTLRASLNPYPRNYFGGGAGNDVFGPSGGVDVIDGGDGRDTVKVSGQFSDYVVTKDVGVIVVTSAGQSDFLYGVERVQFSDRGLAFDLGIDGNAGKVMRAIGVIFGTGSFHNSALIGKELGLLDQGMSYEAFMQRNLDTVLGADATSEEIVNLMYKNVTSRDPSAEEMDYYTSLLDDGVFTPGELGVYAANTVQNELNVIVLGIGIKGASVAYTDYLL